MTNTVQIADTELSARLPDVLRQVEAGSEFIVTRRGKPIARLMAADGASREPLAAETAEESRSHYQVRSTPAAPEGALTQLVSAPAMRRVLSIFLLDPAIEIHQREIARRSGAGLRSVQLAVKRLVGMGLLADRRDGNRLYYRAVRSERFEQVRSLLAREFGIAEVIARHLGSQGKEIYWAFIFGSAASGEDKIGSDIDLLAVTDASDDELVEPIAQAQRELGRDIDVISYRPDEFARKRAEGNHFVRSVLAQPRFDVIGSDNGS